MKLPELIYEQNIHKVNICTNIGTFIDYARDELLMTDVEIAAEMQVNISSARRYKKNGRAAEEPSEKLLQYLKKRLYNSTEPSSTHADLIALEVRLEAILSDVRVLIKKQKIEV